ncbi:hypothetical protein ACFSYD_22435 [Paracoccus aerius]
MAVAGLMFSIAPETVGAGMPAALYAEDLDESEIADVSIRLPAFD